MLTPYLIFNGTCEKAFNFYAEAFGGGKTIFARLDSNPNNLLCTQVLLSQNTKVV